MLGTANIEEVCCNVMVKMNGPCNNRSFFHDCAKYHLVITVSCLNFSVVNYLNSIFKAQLGTALNYFIVIGLYAIQGIRAQELSASFSLSLANLFFFFFSRVDMRMR